MIFDPHPDTLIIEEEPVKHTPKASTLIGICLVVMAFALVHTVLWELGLL
jgi:hypothetical protein